MNSISPQMLGLAAGHVTLVKTPASPTTVRSLLRVAARRRWVLTGAVAGGAVVGILVTLLSTPQYTSTTRLQIARETAQVVNLGAVSREVSIGDQEFYQTQYGLMRAQALAERVARDLGVVDDPGFFRMFGKTDEFSGDPGPAGRAKRNEFAGQILLRQVEIAPIHGSSLVDIQATTPSPDLSLRLARTWSQDFIASNLERRLGPSAYASQFLQTRLEQLRDRLETSERRAVDYAASQGIIDLPTPTNGSKGGAGDAVQARSLVTDDLVALNTALEKATADRIDADTRLTAAGGQADASEDALNYRAIGLLRDARADAAAEYARSAALSPDDPATKAARAEIDALDAAIQGEKNRVHAALQQSYQAALAREQALTRRVNALKSALAELRQRSIQYNLYQRDADTNRALYDALLQRYKEIGVAGAAESNNVAVVDGARLPDSPSSPRLTVNLLLFTLAGAFLGAAVAALLDQFDAREADPGEPSSATT